MRLLACFLLSVNLAACATTAHYVALPDDGGVPAELQVATGKRVVLEMKDGRELRFRVREVNEEGIAGDAGLARWQDIQTLRIVESDGSNKFWAVLGLVATVILIDAAVDGVGAAALLSCDAGC